MINIIFLLIPIIYNIRYTLENYSNYYIVENNVDVSNSTRTFVNRKKN
jgi:hypothetical protein